MDELVRLLSHLEHDEMGLAGIPLDRLRPVASQLVAWYEGSQDMWHDRST